MYDLCKIERVFGVHFNDPGLCREAFTHKSFSAEHNLKYDNQRLEFLGDAVVQIILTEEIFRRYPDIQEGELTKIRSALVNQESLAAFARDMGLGEFLMLGRGESEQHGEERDSTVSDLFEAFFGALYLDQGLEAARTLFLQVLRRNRPEPADVLDGLNPKGALQEYTQRRGLGIPCYRLLNVTGPAHELIYEMEVSVPDCEAVSARASSRKHAECAAARLLLERLRNADAHEQEK